MRKVHLASIDESLRRIADAVGGGGGKPVSASESLKVLGRHAKMIVLSDEDYRFFADEMSGNNNRIGYIPTGPFSWSGVEVIPIGRIQRMEKGLESLEDENSALRAMLEVAAPKLLEKAIKENKVRP